MLRCPVCRVDNAAGPACRRCKADLSLLFTLEEQRQGTIAAAHRALALGQWHEARRHALAADQLRHDQGSGRLVALTALLCRDFDGAWHAYQQLRKASAPRTQ